MHGRGGACIAGGLCVWQGGACIAGGHVCQGEGMHGGKGACMAGEGTCMAGGHACHAYPLADTSRYGQ